MFRTTKKRTKSNARRTRPADSKNEDDSSEDDGQIKIVSRVSKVRTKSKSAVRSFLEEDDTPKREKKKKRKRGGFGFGGSLLKASGDDAEDPEQIESNEVVAEEEASSRYGKGSLEKLRLEQKYQEPKLETQDEHKTSCSASIAKGETKPNDLGGDFISLQGSGDKTKKPVILSGDDALLYEKVNENPTSFGEETGDHLEKDWAHQEIEESEEWEERLVRRAGVEIPTAPSSSAATKTSAVVPLSKLRTQVNSTITQIENRRDDLEKASARRQAELVQTQKDLERQEADLKEAGTAVEYYQQLREQLALWVGAMRDLKSKIQPIQHALTELETEVARTTSWKDWEDDMCAILHEADLLQQVLGRQPPNTVFERTVRTVDEFGRDLKSQNAMIRERRIQRRRRIQRERQGRDESDTDAFMSDDEGRSLRHRRQALKQGLEIAMQDIEEDYVALPNLVSIFCRWGKTYSEEYDQCYANMSFADLASVLVQAEICKQQKDLALRWLEGQSETLAWTEALKVMENSDNRSKQLEIVIESVYIPFLSNIFDNSAYNLLSTKQTQALCSIFRQLLDSLEEKSPTRSKLIDCIAGHIGTSLEDVSIVIVKSFDKKHGSEVEDALNWASIGQLRRLKKLLLNVLMFWAPCLPEGKWVENLLDFLASKFLFLLSSLQTNFPDETIHAFLEIWQVLTERDWLSKIEYMVYAAPLRAASLVYKPA